MKTSYDILIVGAGAAGLIAAGRAAEKGASVLLVEKMERSGRKLLITGKGRCNISNDAPQSTYYKNIYPNGRYLKHAFSAFFSKEIVNLLNEMGVEVTTERGNRIFPTSNQAKEVQQALLKWVQKNGVEIVYSSRVSNLIIENKQINGVKVIRNNVEKEITSKSVILCTGGKSYPATGSTGDGYAFARQAGHTIIEPQPALVPLVCKGNTAEKLQGLALKNARASLWIDGKKQSDEFGELLFTHFGLSGPIVLTLSREAVVGLARSRKVNIVIDLKPALDEQKLDARLLRDIDVNGKKLVENLFRSWLPAKMIPVFLEELAIDGKKEAHQLTSKERRKIGFLMKNFEFEITGHRGFKEAIVTAGGVNTLEVDNKTMESKLVKGLYFAGEVLDLDANTGGFNLQIAWSTGWLAGDAATLI